MKLSIALAATCEYLYAWKPCIRRIINAASHRNNVHVIFVSDETEEARAAFEFLKKESPKKWELEHRQLPLDKNKGGEKYKIESQLLIAKLHGEMFTACRAANADQCWTVEPDILVRPDSLRLMEWALEMPREDGTAYYDIAICTYPNGLFIGGHGDPSHPICEDFKPEERTLPEEIKARYESHLKEEKEWIESKKMPDEEWQKKAQALNEDIKKCSPIGNIWELNAKFGWRRRGWLDFAYPGIGRGAIVPVDWVGQGCNLLSKKALSLSSFEGYDGKGTQDLFLCWKKYNPAKINMVCITHSPCDHVKKQDDKIIHLQASHEQLGESQGHLRVIEKEWIDL